MYGKIKIRLLVLPVVAAAAVSFTLAASNAHADIIDGGTVNIPQSQFQPDGTANVIWTINDDEGTTGVDSPIWNRQLVGPNGSFLAISNNTQAGVGAFVLHFHSDREINAFTWQIRQIFATAASDNTDTFFVGWTTDSQPGFGNGAIDPSAFTPIAALTETGAFNTTFEKPSFSVTGISSQDIYIFVGRNDLNAGPDETSNVFFNAKSSNDASDRDASFFTITASSPAPEPASLLLLGLGGLAMLSRKRRGGR